MTHNAESNRITRLPKLILICLLLSFQLTPPVCVPVMSQSPAYSPVRARQGVVASSDEIASQVGVEILKRGGNAVDAAVAVGLALAVTWPGSGNIGGGGFMLIRMADGKTTAIDYRERAPAKARRDIFLDQRGEVIPDITRKGHRAVGVPGTVAGFALALEKYGTMKWRDVIEPARRLASEGFVFSDFNKVGRVDSVIKHLEQFPETRRIFLRDGNHYQVGDTFKQPDLAETLKRLQKDGPREFYEGRTAQLIGQEMDANGGLITLEDLKAYEAKERPPVRGTYRGYEIISMSPPSTGGTLLIEMLNVLEQYDLAAMGHNSSAKYHLMIEVMRRGFADRARHFGDPDFVKVPVAELTSKSYAAGLAKTINLDRATPSTAIRNGRANVNEPTETTHFSVVDAMGNAVSNTYTLENAYGSGVTVRGAGFLLNNEMNDFTVKAGIPTQDGLIQSEANIIAAGKRPVSSTTPTIVLKDGKLFAVLGSEGGPTIITQVLQVLTNVIDHGMNLQHAVNAPRIHHQWLPDVVRYEPYGIAKDVMDALTKKGHRFGLNARYWGDVEGIMIEPATGMRLGASDPRNPNARAVGY
ncbi:MAG TPA: gamma-glutamyltransferase [Pyrinomonadaceae bacterium]